MRRAIFWTHLTMGAAAGAVIFIMSFTGVVLAFERQIVPAIDGGLRTVSAPPDARPMPVEDLLEHVRQAEGRTPTALVVRPGRDASVEFLFGRERGVYADPYTGAVLGEGSQRARAFFAAVERWHRSLGAALGTRGAGHWAIAFGNLFFLFIVVSGVYLWLPGVWNRHTLRNAAWYRRGLRGRARDWNWHNATGIWLAAPLFVITLSGAVMSFPLANALLYRLAGTPVPARQPRPAPAATPAGPVPPLHLESGLAEAKRLYPQWKTLTAALPRSGQAPLLLTADWGTGGEPTKKAELTFDRASGRLVRTAAFSDRSRGQRWRIHMRFLHTGEDGGLPGQLLAALASAGTCLLVWTGYAMAFRRLRGRLARRKTPAVEEELALR